MSEVDELTVEYENAEPRADCMIQSLRAFGYDLPSAIADIIDNSISANAGNILLDFHWDGGNSTIAIIDDGCGMKEGELLEAMRPGSRNPLEERHPKDLGRFGLGLKTASFSQCKRLTVASKTDKSDVAIRCWDLDYVGNCGEWRLLKVASPEFERYSSELSKRQSGTVVLWEKMDRVVSEVEANDAIPHNVFLERIGKVKQHVAMVFHRFLDGPRAIKIQINGSFIRAWDPFLTREPATQLLTDEPLSIFGSRLDVKPYILPHKSKIDSEVHKAAAGPRGWNAQQGFYIYRNRRLLVAGDWLGLGFHKEEHYNLARIRLDIPNSMDAEWEIDVKKSRACPPPTIRDDLRRLAEVTRRNAREVYRHRGARLYQGPFELVLVWEKRVRHSKISYAINRQHPLIKDILDFNGDTGRRVKAMLALLEETVPVPTIAIDCAETPDVHSKAFEHAPVSLQHVMEETYLALRKSGLSKVEAKLRVAALEPFNEYPELIAACEDSLGEIS